MKSAIIYGGAFNPPTNAHQKILQACFDYARDHKAEVWVMPSGDRTDKTIAVSLTHRFDMINALVSSVNTYDVHVRVEDIEITSTEQTETYQTYCRLAERYRDVTQIWVFGSDSVQTMKTWGDGEWLYENLNMLVVERPGYALPNLPPCARVLPFDASDISSTMVRDHIAQQKDITHLVPAHVYKTITSHQLFL